MRPIASDDQSRVARFDIDTPGDERGLEGGSKEFSMRLKHAVEKERGAVQTEKKALLYDGDYFTPAQQDEWTARGHHRDGQDILCDRAGQVLDSRGNMMNFVIVDDPDYREGNGERLIIAPEAQSTHSQLARGLPVKYSGEMVVESGRIVNWNSKAGHYRQPSLEKAEKWRAAIPDMARAAVQDKHRIITRIAAVLKHNPTRSVLHHSFKTKKALLDSQYEQVRARGEMFQRYFGTKLSLYSDQASTTGDDDDVSTAPLHPERTVKLPGVEVDTPGTAHGDASVEPQGDGSRALQPPALSVDEDQSAAPPREREERSC